jgi:hypothetical protein
MRVMGFLRADEHTEAGQPPSQELMDRMGVFVQEAFQAGVIADTNGLMPSSAGKRIKLDSGKITVVDGPFTPLSELVTAYAIYDVKSMDEAVEWTKRFLQVIGTGECELRPIEAMEEPA